MRRPRVRAEADAITLNRVIFINDMYGDRTQYRVLIKYLRPHDHNDGKPTNNDPN